MTQRSQLLGFGSSSRHRAPLVFSSGQVEKNAQAVEAIAALSMVIEARDPYTAGHQWRVSRFARLIADHAELPRPLAATCELAGFIHDVGKIGMPDAVLQKTDRLNEDEFAIIKTHPVLGEHLIWSDLLDNLVRDAVRHHHERPDGKGYPDGLNENEIATPASIVSLSDSLDAMTSKRPYRQGMPLAKALDIIRAERGHQFVRRWADVLLEKIPTASLNHVIGHSFGGMPLVPCPVCSGPIALYQDNDVVITGCRICGAGLRQEGGTLVPTGGKATAADLVPLADKTLVSAIVNHCLQEQAGA